ncbi:MAG: hypothetical protein ABH864_04470 [archaeon]
MEQTQTPTWREKTVVEILGPDGTPFEYNPAQVDPMNFFDLAEADYGEGFKRPTASQLVPLVRSAAHPDNRDKENPRKLLGRWLAGNTLILLGKKGFYGVDFPNVRGQRIYMGEKTLQGRLGKREDNGVVSSDDGLVRFTHYGFKTGDMDSGELAVNRGIAVAYKGFANTELLAQASSHYRLEPCFSCVSKAPEKPEIKVPGVCASGALSSGLDVSCYGGPGLYWYAFGVRDVSASAEARTAAKK